MVGAPQHPKHPLTWKANLIKEGRPPFAAT